MPNREKVVKELHDLRRYLEDKEWSANRVDRRTARVYWQAVTDAIALLKEQDDEIRNLLSDLNDLQKEHEKLLDKKITLITNGQEVVRCKDCKHRLECDYWIENGDDWYCADGERKDDDA